MNGSSDPFPEARRADRPRWWLHILLLVITLVTTSVMGAAFVRSFRMNEPVDVLDAMYGYPEMLHNPGVLWLGLPFSLTLLAILLAHEMGHYLVCQYYGVNATVPFFIPSPFAIGTFGAFIRIRAPIYSKRILFDVAVAGPVAGFALLLPLLVIGVACSKVVPGIADRGELQFGLPLVVSLVERVIFPGVPSSDIYLHPIARAAWVGVLATALNLLPIGQLDGGHILYAFAGERTRILSKFLVVLLIPIGILYSYSWLVWAVFLLGFGTWRHPVIYDRTPLGSLRTWLGWVSLLLFVLSFTVEPIRH